MRYRQIPIGVFETGALLSEPNMDLFACGNDTCAADFYSFTVSDMCGGTDFAIPSLIENVVMAGSSEVPIFIADNTCSVILEPAVGV